MKNFLADPVVISVVDGSSKSPGEMTDVHLSKILGAIRRHLGMDVAFVSEFVDGKRVFKHLDANISIEGVEEGGSDPLEQSYCQRIVDGRLPSLIPDATQNEEAKKIPATLALPVGAHLGIPLKLSDGRLYGTFCCFSLKPDQSLGPRDLDLMRMCAEIVATLIDQDLQAKRQQQEARARVENVLYNGLLEVVYQPIYDMQELRIVGYEALSRIKSDPPRGPDLWFKEATQVGLGLEIEMRAVAQAMLSLPWFRQNEYLTINVSPDVVLDPEFSASFALTISPPDSLSRLVLEITEHSAINHYAEIAAVLDPFRRLGMRVAVDDVGAGYASFRHILNLSPDIIKIDMGITGGADENLDY